MYLHVNQCFELLDRMDLRITSYIHSVQRWVTHTFAWPNNSKQECFCSCPGYSARLVEVLRRFCDMYAAWVPRSKLSGGFVPKWCSIFLHIHYCPSFPQLVPSSLPGDFWSPPSGLSRGWQFYKNVLAFSLKAFSLSVQTCSQMALCPASPPRVATLGVSSVACQLEAAVLSVPGPASDDGLKADVWQFLPPQQRAEVQTFPQSLHALYFVFILKHACGRQRSIVALFCGCSRLADYTYVSRVWTSYICFPSLAMNLLSWRKSETTRKHVRNILARISRNVSCFWSRGCRRF